MKGCLSSLLMIVLTPVIVDHALDGLAADWAEGFIAFENMMQSRLGR